jgi:hypothetical protein
MRPVALQQYMSEHDLKSVTLIFISTQRLFTLEKNSIFLYCGAKKIRWKIFKVQEREFSDLFYFEFCFLFHFLLDVEFRYANIYFFLLLAFQSIPLSLIYRFCVTRFLVCLFFEIFFFLLCKNCVSWWGGTEIILRVENFMLSEVNTRMSLRLRKCC